MLSTQRDKSSFLDLSLFLYLLIKIDMDLNLFVDAYKSDIEMATNEAKNDFEQCFKRIR